MKLARANFGRRGVAVTVAPLLALSHALLNPLEATGARQTAL